MTEMFSNYAQPNIIATSHVWLLENNFLPSVSDAIKQVYIIVKL